MVVRATRLAVGVLGGHVGDCRSVEHPNLAKDARNVALPSAHSRSRVSPHPHASAGGGATAGSDEQFRSYHLFRRFDPDTRHVG